MGLDGVELIMEFEKFFGIKIEDKEAEQLYTIQDVVDIICLKANVTKKHCPVYHLFSENILHNLKLFTQESDLPNDSNILTHIDLRNKEVVKQLSSQLGLLLEPYEPNNFPFWHHLYKKEHDDTVTISEFVEALAMLNYIELYPSSNKNSIQAIYLGVGQLTYYKSGVNIFEIKRNKSFTNDLGID